MRIEIRKKKDEIKSFTSLLEFFHPVITAKYLNEVMKSKSMRIQKHGSPHLSTLNQISARPARPEGRFDNGETEKSLYPLGEM